MLVESSRVRGLLDGAIGYAFNTHGIIPSTDESAHRAERRWTSFNPMPAIIIMLLGMIGGVDSRSARTGLANEGVGAFFFSGSFTFKPSKGMYCASFASRSPILSGK